MSWEFETDAEFEEQLAWMRLVADRVPHPTGRPIEVYRRGKRGRRRLRQPKLLEMRVAASDAVREGEQALVDRYWQHHP